MSTNETPVNASEQAAYEALRDFYWNHMETLESSDARYAYVPYGDLQRLEELFVAALPDIADLDVTPVARGAVVTALRRCWWCGRAAEVDTALVEDNGLLRDDSTVDGSESWICTDNSACIRQPKGQATGG